MQDGYTDLPPGKLANVVTYLEMREPPAWASTTLSELAIRREPRADLTGTASCIAKSALPGCGLVAFA